MPTEITTVVGSPLMATVGCKCESQVAINGDPTESELRFRYPHIVNAFWHLLIAAETVAMHIAGGG